MLDLNSADIGGTEEGAHSTKVVIAGEYCLAHVI